jgi:formylglycine-generating enzyme required for sulfatase activity
MRKILIAVLCAAAAASQALAQTACVAADDGPIQLESAEVIVGKLGNLTKIKRGTFETEDEFQERVSQSALSLNLDRHIVVGPVNVYTVKYDFEREMLLIPGSYVSYETGFVEGFEVGSKVVDLGSYQGQNAYGAKTTVTRNSVYNYSLRGADEPKKDGKDGERWVDLVELVEPKWEGGAMGTVQYIGIPMDRDRARGLENKTKIAFVYKPTEPFYSLRPILTTSATVANPSELSSFSQTLFGDVFCALVLDDKGKKLATILRSGTPLTAEAEMAASRKAVIASLQTALIDRGYEPGTTDGVIIESTLLALESFSSASGFSLPGVDLADADTGLINALTSAVRDTPIPDPKTGQAFIDCAVCPSMMVVPAGSFTMGSTKSEDGWAWGPRREVTIGLDFAVGRYEVTWAEWNACVADRGCEDFVFTKQEEVELRSAVADKGTLPVRKRSWEDAQAYVSWLTRKTGKTYRLLSEAEWEYSARAGTTTPFSFGSTISAGQANYNSRATTPVGSFPANAFGLYDMHGNVKEWTQDCWSKNYRGAPKDGSARTSGVVDCQWRVVRGGSYGSLPEDIRSSARWLPLYNESTGFRVARTLGAD